MEVPKPKLETRARPNQLKLEQVEPFQFELSEGIGGDSAKTYFGLLLLDASLSLKVGEESITRPASIGAGEIINSPRRAMLSGDEFI